MKTWQYAVKRVTLIAVGVGITYVTLVLARRGDASAEIRGIWAGAAGMAVMSLLEDVVPPRNRR